MGPPRLTVVHSTDDEAAREIDAGAASPVHGLIASIEQRNGEARPAEATTAELVVAPAASQAVPQAAATAAPHVAPPVDPDQREALRILEAVIFASAEPLDEARLMVHLKAGVDVAGLLGALQADYRARGVNLVKVAGKWTFRTAEDLSWVLERQTTEERRLSKAALETLAIVAYHQPATRAEIEEIRGVSISKGTLDVLMHTGWVRPRGRRRAPGKPITYGTTEAFLKHFSLDAIKDLPGLAELKGSGLLDANLPPDFKVPEPTDIAALMPDELPLEAGGADDEQVQAELDLDAPDEADDEAVDEVATETED